MKTCEKEKDQKSKIIALEIIKWIKKYLFVKED